MVLIDYESKLIFFWTQQTILLNQEETGIEAKTSTDKKLNNPGGREWTWDIGKTFF